MSAHEGRREGIEALSEPCFSLSLSLSHSLSFSLPPNSGGRFPFRGLLEALLGPSWGLPGALLGGPGGGPGGALGRIFGASAGMLR